jgi:hypothetical protein
VAREGQFAILWARRAASADGHRRAIRRASSSRGLIGASLSLHRATSPSSSGTNWETRRCWSLGQQAFPDRDEGKVQGARVAVQRFRLVARLADDARQVLVQQAHFSSMSRSAASVGVGLRPHEPDHRVGTPQLGAGLRPVAECQQKCQQSPGPRGELRSSDWRGSLSLWRRRGQIVRQRFVRQRFGTFRVVG